MVLPRINPVRQNMTEFFEGMTKEINDGNVVDIIYVDFSQGVASNLKFVHILADPLPPACSIPIISHSRQAIAYDH